MKHIKNTFIILSLFIIQLLAMIISPIIVGIALMLNRIETKNNCINSTSNPSTKFKDRWIDSIWGNDDDGLDGDIYYLKDHVKFKRNFFTRFNWLVFRNPVHNLGLKLGFNGVAIKHIGFRKTFNNSICETKVFNNDFKNCLDSKKDKQGFEYTEVYDKHNKMYPMYRLRWKYPFVNYGLKCNIGWKNWNVHKVNSYYRYTFTLLINPFKKFK